MSCNCQNSNYSSTNNGAISIERNFLGDTLLLSFNLFGNPEVTINGNSNIVAIVKSLDTGLTQNINITDLVNGNNFNSGVVKLESNFAFLAGTYQVYLRITNGTQIITIDPKQFFVYAPV
jgi:hypothetical protein